MAAPSPVSEQPLGMQGWSCHSPSMALTGGGWGAMAALAGLEREIQAPAPAHTAPNPPSPHPILNFHGPFPLPMSPSLCYSPSPQPGSAWSHLDPSPEPSGPQISEVGADCPVFVPLVQRLGGHPSPNSPHHHGLPSMAGVQHTGGPCPATQGSQTLVPCHPVPVSDPLPSKAWGTKQTQRSQPASLGVRRGISGQGPVLFLCR